MFKATGSAFRCDFDLIDNAIKHGGDHGVVTASVRREPGHSVLSIIDNGPGIPAKERGHVFQEILPPGAQPEHTWERIGSEFRLRDCEPT